MAYFSKDFIQFFKELIENNHKDWFDENRKRYEMIVKEPFKVFVNDLIVAVQKFDPAIMIQPKNAIFRINRDVRFSKNKQPYKTNVAAFISRDSKKEQFPGYYVHFDANGVWLGGGLYELSAERLFKVRQEIMYNEEAFKQAVGSEAFVKEFGEIKGEKNKILKPPFKEIASQSPILYHKQFYFMQEYGKEMIMHDNLVHEIAKKLEAALPLQQFLRLALEETD